jgi:hypothetical protein
MTRRLFVLQVMRAMQVAASARVGRARVTLITPVTRRAGEYCSVVLFVHAITYGNLPNSGCFNTSVTQ